MNGVDNKSNDKYVDKYFKQTMFLCILSIAFYAVSLLSVTWAWYTATIEVPSNIIETGTYEIIASVVNNDDKTSVTVNENKFTLDKGENTYEVTLTPKGTEDISGYAVFTVTYNGNETETYYTVQLDNDNESVITFKIINNSGTEASCVVDYVWGTYVNSKNEVLLGSEDLKEIELEAQQSTTVLTTTDDDTSSEENTKQETQETETKQEETTTQQTTETEGQETEQTTDTTGDQTTESSEEQPTDTSGEDTDAEGTDAEGTDTEGTGTEGNQQEDGTNETVN